MSNPVLLKRLQETKKVTAPSKIVYEISVLSSADYMAALGFVPSLRKAKAGEGADPIEMISFQQNVCSRCVRSMEYGGVLSDDIGDPAEWPKADVEFLWGEIQKLSAGEGEQQAAATAKELL